MTSRRRFMVDTAHALAGLTVAGYWPTGARGPSQRVPAAAIRSGATGASFCRSAMAPPDLRGLAMRALDGATAAGASFADVRVAERYDLDGADSLTGTSLSSYFSYGIRVIVDGSWAFVHGCVPSEDRLVEAARNAVATARGYATLKTASVELASTPVVQGEWTTPIHDDPFLIPLRDQVDLASSYTAVQERVTPAIAWLGGVMVSFNWTKEIRVYASTEGSLITQTFYRSRPDVYNQDVIKANGSRTLLPDARVYLSHLLVPLAGGYETVVRPDLPTRIQEAAELAKAYSMMPRRRFDVGRFPVVVDGFVTGQLIGGTLGVALELDRVLGYESGASGMSWVAPPDAMQERTMVNPLLTVMADRTAPHYCAAKWDDDGAPTESYTAIKDGVVVDYHTSRETASALTAVYQAQGRPVRSHGCAVATNADDRVMVQTPHLTVAPARGATSVEDLCQGIARGLLVTQHQERNLSIGPSMTSGLLQPDYTALEIVRGKIVGRVKDVGLEFQTLPLWKQLGALGGTETVCENQFYVNKGMPWQETLHTTSAPAAFFKAVNVIDLGRKL